MAKYSTNFASIKPSSGTRSNENEVNDHVLSPGCNIRIEILLISCGDIELNPGPTFTCLTCASNFVTQKLLTMHENDPQSPHNNSSLPILFLKKWTNNEAN